MHTRIAFVVLVIAIAPAVAGCGNGGSSPPQVAVRPSSGFTMGGTEVTITGSGFLDATAVTFGGNPADSFLVVDDGTIAATTPPGTPGIVTVSVEAPAGTKSGEAYMYVTHPPVAAAEVHVDFEGDSDSARLLHGPEVCCDGPNVYVTWSERRPGFGVRNVHFQRSHDRGLSWQTTAALVQTNGEGMSSGIHPQLCCSGGNVYVSWLDSRWGEPTPYMNRSFNGGVSFESPDMRISTGIQKSTTTPPAMCCSGNTVVACWLDDRAVDGALHVYLNRSTDGGTTWLPEDVRLSTYALDAFVGPTQPEVCCDGQNVYVTWSDARSGNYDVYFMRSADGGATWPPNETQINDDLLGKSAEDPKICCDGQTVYVAWLDDRDDGLLSEIVDVYVNASTDGGVLFGGNRRVNTLPAGNRVADQIDLCCRDSTLHVTWTEPRTPGRVVLYNRSRDTGASFLGSDIRVDRGDAGCQRPQICCSGEVVHIAWWEMRSPSAMNDVFVNTSADGGSTWLDPDVRLDTDIPGPGHSEDVRLCCDGAMPYVVWSDARYDAQVGPRRDVFFGTYSP